MRGGPSLKGKGGLVGFRKSLNGKEGRVDFRKNLRFKGGLVGFRRTLIINKKTNIIYNVVSTHTCLHYILY